MELIDKTAIIAEIKKLYKEDYKFLPSDIVESVQDFKDDLLRVLDSLSTVKDVDLEKEYKEFIDCDNGRSMFETANHFYKLGLKAKGDIFVVTRCEGLTDYVEKAFIDEADAENYCRPYNEDGISFIRDITKVKLE